MALLYGCLMGKIVKTEHKKYRLVHAVFEHEDFGSLAEVMEILRDFREERDAINEERREEFETFFKELGAQEGGEHSIFLERYNHTELIGSIFLPYMNTVRQRERQKKEIKSFVCAWAELLTEYFSIFEARYEARVTEYMKKQERAAKELMDGYIPTSSSEQVVLEELRFELRQREQ